MKKLTILATLLTLLVMPAALLAEDGSWTGEVLDLKCYEKDQKGEGHASCAVRCLDGGGEMGLLVDGDVVYVDTAASDAEAVGALKKLGGKMAKVSGSTTKDGDKVTVTVTAAEPAA